MMVLIYCLTILVVTISLCASSDSTVVVENKASQISCNDDATTRKLFTTFFSYFSQTFTKTTQYKVCSRPSSILERLLAKKLYRLRKRGLKSYLTRHQRCPYRKHVYPDTDKEKSNQQFSIIFEIPKDAVITYNGCLPRKSMDQLNTLSMCRQCVYEVKLPDSYIPQYHSYMTCGDAGDISCLSGEGVCVMNQAYVPVLFDENNVGRKYLSKWKEIRIMLTKSCSCQVLQNSWLQLFIQTDRLS